MKRKVVLIIFVFLLNMFWVNAISVTNTLASHYNIVIKTTKQTNLNNNNIMDELDVLLETDLSYKNESAVTIGKKIDNYLKGEMKGLGEFIAKYAIVSDVDPYLIASMIVENTECDVECSVLVKQCKNVSKAIYNKENIGEVSCFGGNYQKFNTLEDSIKSFIKYVKVNFYENDLKTPGTIYKTYKKDVRWVFRVNQYIDKIKSSSIAN